MKLILDTDSVSEPQLRSMVETLLKSKASSYVDICIRLNGEDLWFQADWLKYLSIEAPNIDTSTSQHLETGAAKPVNSGG